MIIAVDARPLVREQVAGAEQRARNILAAWKKMAAEHQFHLIYPRPAEGYEEEGGRFDESVLKELPANFHPLEISSYNLPSNIRATPRILNALARSISRLKADVYHSFTPDVPRIKTCPVVPTIHDLSFELDPVVRRTAAGRVMHHVMAQSARHAKRLIAVSSQTKYDIASIYRLPPERIDVVYNGIDSAFSPSPPDALPTLKPVHTENHIRPPYVLAVGADIPRRNYARMLPAMQAVWASTGTPDAARTLWVIAGRDRWEQSAIYGAAQAAGVLPRMRFVSAPSNDQLADLYRGATLTCCASSFEGFGLSVLESMACGAAVACSDMRSLREVAEDAAVYFPHDDSEAMGQTIAGLLEDAEYRRQLKYRGIYRAGLFTWQTAAQLTLASLSAAADQ